MSLLDNLFRQTAGAELVVSPSTVDSSAAIAPGFLYEVSGGLADVTLTMPALDVAAMTGKRIAIKLVGMPEGAPGDVTVVVPGSATIEDEFGTFGSSVTIVGGRSAPIYREWFCTPGGAWLAVTPPVTGFVPAAATYENGGPHEISVAGLAGVLVTPQVAGGIVTTTGPTLLVVGDWADGEYVKRVGATAVGGTPPGSGGSVTSELWAAPASPHGNDREMTALPAGWALYKMVSNLGVLTTPDATAITKAAPSSVARVEANKNERRSWLLMQPPADGSDWFYGFRLGVLASHDYLFRARLGALQSAGAGLTNNATNLKLIVCANSGIVPSFTTQTAHIGWESDPSDMHIGAMYRSGGTNNIIAAGPNLNAGHGADLEVLMRKSAAVYDYFIVSPSLTTLLASANFAAGTLDTGGDVWVGFHFTSSGVIAAGTGAVLKADYYRQQDTGTFYY